MDVAIIEERLPVQTDPDCSPGLHVSQIVRDIALMLGKLEPREEGFLQDRYELGYIWEGVLQRAFADHQRDLLHHPGEFELDGIVGSPDAIEVDTGNGYITVEEYKATWYSMKTKKIENMWLWLTQIKAYCKMVDTRLAILRVLWINGDYTWKSQVPQYRAYHLVFTQDEIGTNWDMLVKHAKLRGWL